MKATTQEYLTYSNITTHPVQFINNYLKKYSGDIPKGDLVDALTGNYNDCPNVPTEVINDLLLVYKKDSEAKCRASLLHNYGVDDALTCELALPPELEHSIKARWSSKAEDSNSSKWNIDGNGLLDLQELRAQALTFCNLSELSDRDTFLKLTVDEVVQVANHAIDLGHQQLEREAKAISIVAALISMGNTHKQAKPSDFNPWIKKKDVHKIDSISASILYALFKLNKLPSWVSHVIKGDEIEDNRCTLERSIDRVLINKYAMLVNPNGGRASMVIINPMLRHDISQPLQYFTIDSQPREVLSVNLEEFDNYLLLEDVEYL